MHTVTGPKLTLIQYAGGGYTYLCEAARGTARSDSSWTVLRIDDTTGDMVYAGDKDSEFEHEATDLATVAALTYTLGA